MKLRVSTAINAIDPRVDPAGDETGDDESTIHPTVSSASAVERMIIPTFVRYRSRSIRIRAITGIAEIDIAVARKSANTGCEIPAGTSSSGNSKPRPNPARNGNPKPPIHPPTTAFGVRRSMPSRVSSPPIRTRKMTPIHHKIEQRSPGRVVREQRLERVRPHHPEERWPEAEAEDQLTHHLQGMPRRTRPDHRVGPLTSTATSTRKRKS